MTARLNQVGFPVRRRMRSQEVADLQVVLGALIDAGVLDGDASRELREPLDGEHGRGVFGPATEKAVALVQEKLGLDYGLAVTGEVDEPTARALNALAADLGTKADIAPRAELREVSGVVRFESGLPAPFLRVAAVDRDLRDEQPLKTGETGRDGSYRLDYSELDADARELGSADLVVRAFGPDGSLLVASPILFNAAPQAQVDLTIPRERLDPPSLFTRVGAAISPSLGDVAIENLDETDEHDDLTFLVGETGFEKRMLARFVLAHRLAREGIEPEFWFAMLADTALPYGEGRGLAHDLPRIWVMLGGLDEVAVSRALESAVDVGDIDRALLKIAARWIEEFVRLMGGRLLDDGVGSSFVKSALEHAGIDGAQAQEQFSESLRRYGSLTPELVKELEDDPSFGHDRVADVSASFQLGRITRGDFAVVAMLKDEFGVRQPDQIAALARVGADRWAELITKKVADGGIEVPVELDGLPEPLQAIKAPIYASTLEQRFREMFPTQAFAGELERARNNGGARGLEHSDAVLRLLDAHPEFELLRTPIDAFLDDHAGDGPEEVAGDEGFRRELRAVQRVFKLAPTFKATDALLADRLHAAQRIYRLGESQFARRFTKLTGASEAEGLLIWRRAADTHAAVLAMIGDLVGLRDEEQPAGLKRNTGALASFPNWESLFAAGDVCECEQCRSVLSPTAYFADLLTFLEDRKLGETSTVAGVLLGRRPDLGWLELTCENASTLIPYVDLVCEVLEEAVAAGDGDVELVGLTTIPPLAADPHQAVGAALTAARLGPGSEFELSQVGGADPDRWVVHGIDLTALLEKKQTANFYAHVLPNTKADAAELRAYPAYVNHGAYQRLRGARFPFGLPFDLSAEEVRAAFRSANVDRWDLMETLQGAPPADAGETAVAAEYFGISIDAHAAVDEQRLICDEEIAVADQQAIWGEVGNAGWLDAGPTSVANVKIFLAKTGLNYEQLLALLDLGFVNSQGDILIEHLDHSCDTGQKRLTGLSAPALDRIHRFLRLWRKLDGWEMWELDLAVDALGNVLAAPFVVDLHYLCRLRSRLGGEVSVEQMCALFADLNTVTHFTRPYATRQQGLYQRLFFNPKVGQPLDPAFDPATIARSGATQATILGHRSVVQAALGVSERDLDRLLGLTAPAQPGSPAKPYITDDLTLENLSFLWRHAWLPRKLGLDVARWKIVLDLLGERVQTFAHPKTAVEFVERVDRLVKAGFTPDELDWLLTGDRAASAAVSEADATRFLASLRTAINATRAPYAAMQHSDLDSSPGAERLEADLFALLQQLHRDDSAGTFVIDTLRDEVQMTKAGVRMPHGYVFPAAVTDTVRISYDEPSLTLRLTGFLTAAQRDALLKDATLDKSYQDAIADFYDRPRLAIAWLDPVFTAALAQLPSAVDFTVLADPALAARVAYDADARALQVVGVLTQADRDALDGLSADGAFRMAVNSLFTQPRAAQPALSELRWLKDTDLQWPLTKNLDANLTTALTRTLAYLSKRSTDGVVIQRVSTELALPEGLTRRLLSAYSLPAEPLLAYLTGSSFADTIGVIDPTTLPRAFNGWYWATRVASLWKKWKLTLPEWQQLHELTTPARLLDFGALHPDAAHAAPIESFLATSRLIAFKQSVPELHVAFLEVLARLNSSAYGSVADFAADVERLDPTWAADDVEALVDSLDLAYPDDYLQARSWERLRRALSFARSLHAGAASVSAFAAATMTDQNAKALKELFRSALGADDWLALCTEIQDRLRERKRDALTAYLLAQPMPTDAPTGKWDDTTDLYAYYLLDVEMSSCQLTSRIVQGSASVQLFVQRCLMGLEPKVKPQADGPHGDAWRWWTWMSKYRVWQANREVFLWPENWIEPELNRDRSSFMKDLETELLQGAIDGPSVETAFSNYLAKLDGVAQLEPAGFYHEDDADTPILHVFARTKGAEPHLYYYRRFDYRSWTPWEKVDLDITGDYLIPAVIDHRPFLFWPVFVDVPDEDASPKLPIPAPGGDPVSLTKARKKRRLQLAVSEFRQGRWTPRRISKDYVESDSYDGDVGRDGYTFFAIDRGPDHPFEILYSGANGQYDAARIGPGSFSVSGCHGVPERTLWSASPASVITPEGALLRSLKWDEDPDLRTVGTRGTLGRWDDFTLHDYFLDQVDLADVLRPTATGLFHLDFLSNRISVLNDTPGTFAVAPPWQMSYFDRLLSRVDDLPESPIAAGLWIPCFYHDQERTFFVVPELPGGTPAAASPDTKSSAPRFDFENTSGTAHRHYGEIEAYLRGQRDALAATYRDRLTDAYFATATPAQLVDLDETLQPRAPADWTLPFKNDQRRELMVDRYMLGGDWQIGTRAARLYQQRRLEFRSFYHPFVCQFAKLVEDPLQGIPALMRRETQLQKSGFSFRRDYAPTSAVADPWTEKLYPREDVDFQPDGAYSSYNWELFFHVPLLIANALSRNQRFDEARQWYDFIFNPLGLGSGAPGGPSTSRFWITRPFFEASSDEYVQQRIDDILGMLAGDTSVPGFSLAALRALEDQVRDWRTHPFEPHRIAAYRTVAYQKNVFMKYIDNLIAWGDQLFSQDSLESINEATQLYVLAAGLLGARPETIPPQAHPPTLTFNELAARLDEDDFTDVVVDAENLVPALPGTGPSRPDAPPVQTLFFCIPPNEKLLSYWDTVADRLYKIRHCMNIEGVVRQIALLEPRIDPGSFVKAVAAGSDTGAALADLNAPLPLHRFAVLARTANEVCADVKALGSALLSALEKNDAEALSRLRQTQEISILEASTELRRNHIDEARATLESLKRSRELADIKHTYYSTRAFMSPGEFAAMALSTGSLITAAGLPIGHTLASGMRLLPEVSMGYAGYGGSPSLNASSGGGTLAAITSDATQVIADVEHLLDKGSAIAATLASYDRRKNDWDHQATLAAKEIEQLDQSIAAAELRITAAEQELGVHLAQIANATAVDAYMRSKYTAQELYQWQVGQISGVYFQSYKLAYDLAKQAERCYRFELGIADSSYIKFGYWDSLKKGLLAGEALQYDLRRLEASYLERDRREFELTKHVSLRLLNPDALVALRETGRCFFDLPEEIFDLDYPGHYFRRVKSVSLTLPCVAGPYTTISCTLRLLKNSIRVDTNQAGGYARNVDNRGLPADDDRFIETNIPAKAIAASSGQNDSGVFELSFRDERYLPFEGAGAVSGWQLELFTDQPSSNGKPAGNPPPDFGRPLRQFDYDSISDVVLHVKYTAREDVGKFKTDAIKHLRSYFTQADAQSALVMLDWRWDFPGQWSRFLNPADPADGNVFELELGPSLLPIRDQSKAITVEQIAILARCNRAGDYSVTLTPPDPLGGPAALPSSPKSLTRTDDSSFGSLHHATWPITAQDPVMVIDPTQTGQTWRVRMKGPGGADLKKDPATSAFEVQDVIMILTYRWAA